MKISFTREEIAEIVLAHVHRALTPDANRVEFVNSYGGDYAVVTFEAPAPAVEHKPATPDLLGLLKQARTQLPLAAAGWNEEPQYAANVATTLSLIAEIDQAIAAEPVAITREAA